MKMGWVLGWAVPVPWFARYAKDIFPGNTHVFVEPGRDVWECLEKESPFDSLGGYSLGAQLLLENPERASRLSAKIGLFAPVFAFALEAGLGGKIPRTNIRYLSRWLRREKDSALADFYRRAGLNVPGTLGSTISTSVLEWGLSHLEICEVRPPAPKAWKLYCGTTDSLLDSERLAQIDPSVLQVPRASHDPEMLLRAWARELQK